MEQSIEWLCRGGENKLRPRMEDAKDRVDFYYGINNRLLYAYLIIYLIHTLVFLFICLSLWLSIGHNYIPLCLLVGFPVAAWVCVCMCLYMYVSVCPALSFWRSAGKGTRVDLQRRRSEEETDSFSRLAREGGRNSVSRSSYWFQASLGPSITGSLSLRSVLF